MRGRAGGGLSLTLFNILRTAGESGVYRIFPINRGLTEFHTIFVTGLDSRVCIRALQKGAKGRMAKAESTEEEKNFKKGTKQKGRRDKVLY